MQLKNTNGAIIVVSIKKVKYIIYILSILNNFDCATTAGCNNSIRAHIAVARQNII